MFLHFALQGGKCRQRGIDVAQWLPSALNGRILLPVQSIRCQNPRNIKEAKKAQNPSMILESDLRITSYVSPPPPSLSLKQDSRGAGYSGLVQAGAGFGNRYALFSTRACQSALIPGRRGQLSNLNPSG